MHSILNFIKTVVLVEDDIALTSLLKYKIEEKGFQFVSFQSGIKALSYLNVHTNDVFLIIDFELPDINGIDFIIKIKEKNPDIAFIAITGAGSEHIASQFLRLGALDYIIKDIGFLKNFEISFSSILRNISLKKQIEYQQKLIAENEQKYQLIFNHIQDVYIMLNHRMIIYEISPSIYNLIEIPAEMLINQPIFYLLPSKHQWKEAYRQLQKTGELYNFEIELFNRNKNILRICSAHAKLTTYKDNPIAIITLHDITLIKTLQKNLLEISATIEENERTKLAENLHDSVGPILSTSKLYLNRALFAKKNTEKNEIIQETSKLLDEAIYNIRNISNDLMSNVLTEFGLEKSIKRYIQRHVQLKNISINLHYQTTQERFSSIIENIVYRSTVELIHNGIKHSNASEIIINIFENNNLLTLSYTDNGIGFDFNENNFLQQSKGQGLFTLVYRIKTIGGKIYFKRLEKGINFKIEIPIYENSIY